ncbi:ATP-binding cassette domain-containing protein (plasmid) [Streptomyces clavuligerus]|uniref:ABC-type xenobiotic transporter n=5 Tax=Streptomyces clavuligerus TaxID=1901 RepID=B5GMZ5_STRCL|nr:ATP-binding cassette domain-containing protein [Streptomyces clavuligerus]ANW22248.1 antibiotic ABC transporter ATP-binding protein [Streptomyces clavuligerus]AXU17143.1 ATP-binding cassette domain-containing protein [Streptomyces clavuligerus]EDY47691.1 antibiotic resistance ATP-binding protein [Streptomyces clavuligerus]EFG04316.1 Daunorubicin resistance ABC transporter ATP-binding subunit [Streptomyces clavuligerus]MBY6307210.1 ATP-binding cassette domain-containing protein [Streptomyces
MTDSPAVEAVGLVKSYRHARVLDGIDLSVPPGTVFALLGPNGAGKTTTVRVLTTLTRPDAGRVRVAGHDVTTERRLVRRAIGLTGQFASVDEKQTGEENLRLVARLRGLSPGAARRHAAELIERFGLSGAARRTVETYSGGMRRRLDLAAGLVGDVRVVFLDEPTTGLDPRGRTELWRVVTELAAQGTTVFLTTQYLEEADRLADRIALLDGGRLTAQGTADELKTRVAGHRLELTAAGAGAWTRVRERLSARGVPQEYGDGSGAADLMSTTRLRDTTSLMGATAPEVTAPEAKAPGALPSSSHRPERSTERNTERGAERSTERNRNRNPERSAAAAVRDAFRVPHPAGPRDSAAAPASLPVLQVPTDGTAADVRALLDLADPERGDILRFAVRRATLDDVFLALTGRTAREPGHV